jgi:hypothetical protein
MELDNVPAGGSRFADVLRRLPDGAGQRTSAEIMGSGRIDDEGPAVW